MFRFLAVLSVGLALNACVVLTIDPVLTPEDAEFESWLVGIWQVVDDEDETTLLISGSEDGDYVVEGPSDEEGGPYRARLGTVGGHRFLEVWREDFESDDLMVYGRVLLKIEGEGNRFTLSELDGGDVEKALEDGRFETPYLKHDGDLVLTAPTAELKEVLPRMFEDPELLGGGLELRRVQGSGR
jgi:hypothetical protein